MKKSLFCITLILCIFLIQVSVIFAQNGDAGQPGEFLRYGVNARALGMGRAFTAVTDNANAVYWNPGGLYNIIREGMSLTLMYSKLFESTTYNFAAFALPIELLISSDNNGGFASELKKWNLGFGYLGLSSDEFEVRSRGNQVTGETFSDAQTAIYFTLTRAFSIKNHRFGIGANYKLLTHKLYDQKANTAAIDIGIKYQPSISWLEFGANIQNINEPDFKFAQGGSDVIPLSARLGIAINPNTGKKVIDSFTLAFDFMAKPPGDREYDWFAGAEYDLMSTVYYIPIKLRFGINSRESYTFGINIDLPNNSFFAKSNQVLPQLDWAYLPDQNSLGNLAERFSVDFSYTPFTSERWYKRGLDRFRGEQYILAKEDFIRSRFTKNPELESYPLSALLRLGDIEVYLAEDKQKGLQSAFGHYQEASRLPPSQLTEIDEELNQRSFIYLLQALIDKKEYQQVIDYTSNDIVWNNHNTNKDTDPDVIAFRSWAYYYSNQFDEVASSLENAKEYLFCAFLLGITRLEEERYQEARDIFSNILNSGEKSLPDYIYVDPFNDNLILDDAQFLFAYSGYKISRAEIDHIHLNQLTELAEIKRYFPNSDLDKFLDQDNQFEELIQNHEESDSNIFNEIYGIYINALKQRIPFINTAIANLNKESEL